MFNREQKIVKFLLNRQKRICEAERMIGYLEVQKAQ